MPRVELSFCCSRSSNCSASNDDSTLMQDHFVLVRMIIVGRAHDDRCLRKVMLGWRRRRLPLEASGAPRVRRGLGPMPKRPEKINQGQEITRAENRGASARQHVINLKFLRVGMVAARHSQIAEHELRKKC